MCTKTVICGPFLSAIFNHHKNRPSNHYQNRPSFNYYGGDDYYYDQYYGGSDYYYDQYPSYYG